MEIKPSVTQVDPHSLTAHQANLRDLLRYVGEDPNREGLRDTPRRYMKFLKEFMEPAPFNFTTFTNEGGNDMIIQKEIPFYSVCEHHLAPFFGTACVAYLPEERIVGRSKLSRVVQHFASRLQNQERITKQVADFIDEKLNPSGCGVVLTARHMCMEMRGIKARGAETRTSRMTGKFFNEPSARAELLSLI